MKIMKRNGSEVVFDITKIIIAVTKANESVEEPDRMTPVQIQRIAESVELQCQKMNRAPTVEEDVYKRQGVYTAAKNTLRWPRPRGTVLGRPDG